MVGPKQHALTAAVSRSVPETVTASARRGTDMLLPHIQLYNSHLQRMRNTQPVNLFKSATYSQVLSDAGWEF